MQHRIATALLTVFTAFAALLCAPAFAQQDVLSAPVSQPDIFETNRASLDYDRSLPLNAQATLVQDNVYYTKYHVYFDSVNGERVPAFLYIPKPAIKDYVAGLDDEERERHLSRTVKLDGPPWPGMFFMHFLQSDKSLADAFAPQFVMYGYALLAIDGVFKGERKQPGREILEYDPVASVANVRQQVIDIRRGVDFMATRPQDIDMTRLSFFGVSMGAITGTLAVSVDDRFKAVVLADGAADLSLIYQKSDIPQVKEAIEKINALGYTVEQAFDILRAIDPLYYAPHIAPKPALLINGRYDELFPREAMENFHKAVSEPKAVRWFDSGHILPINHVIILTLKWFKTHLKE